MVEKAKEEKGVSILRQALSFKISGPLHEHKALVTQSLSKGVLPSAIALGITFIMNLGGDTNIQIKVVPLP